MHKLNIPWGDLSTSAYTIALDIQVCQEWAVVKCCLYCATEDPRVS